MLNSVIHVMLLGAILLFLGAMTYMRKIVNMPFPESVRRIWLGHAFLLGLALLGCLIFLSMNFLEGSDHYEDWLVAFVFLVSAAFTFSVCVLSCSTAKENARIFELEHAAYFDSTTKLCTRNRILSILKVECLESQKKTRPLTVMMIDIDDFKCVNDRYGHHAGDVVLEQMGRTLDEQRGADGVVGRYGGEEFLLVLPNALPFHSRPAAERIRKAVAGTSFRVGEDLLPITISIGIATSITFRETSDELIARADRALYTAKLTGRNKAVHSEDLVVSGELLG